MAPESQLFLSITASCSALATSAQSVGTQFNFVDVATRGWRADAGQSIVFGGLANHEDDAYKIAGGFEGLLYRARYCGKSR
ncbi:hypothetical protein MMC07_007308 [Pseudocyphellaria aurata]|nr:hypothetical protein [Pseudocyphellaria aurata]